jgi:hypothetical protein
MASAHRTAASSVILLIMAKTMIEEKMHRD